MGLTLFVDLDDTLLGNPMEVFIPAYLRALGNHLAEEVDPELMVASMLEATQIMFQNHKPDQTLKETFDSHFYKAINIPQTSLQTQINQFYETVFPSLKKHTQYLPEAQKFIDNALELGYRVGIATNPLFPKTAILQRLEWAGISDHHSHFVLIPSYETFHFAKPDPAFFAEFLTRIGWPIGPIIMVGNDPDHDINGSSLMGISSFWITNGEKNIEEGLPQPSGKGTIDETLQWIESQDLDSLMPNFESPSAMMATMRGLPAGLSTIFSSLDGMRQSSDSEEINQNLSKIASHLRALEQELNLPQFRKIISERMFCFPEINRDQWGRDRSYPDQDGSEAFTHFLTARLETLALLEDVDEEDWLRGSDQAQKGFTSLKDFVQSLVNHEISLSRRIYELTSLIFPAEQVTQTTQ